MPAKPSVRKGLKFLALCFSRFGMQYTYNVQLARKKYPDVKQAGNSVKCQLLRYACQALSIHGQRNHKIAIDRGFSSINGMKEIVKAGQHACGTLSLRKGLMQLKDKSFLL